MNPTLSFNPSHFSARRRQQVPVAVLASRWSFNYEHYAAVLRVREGYLRLDPERRAEPLPEPPVETAEESPLRQFWKWAVDSVRRRGVHSLVPSALRRAS
jgi:hypothetical protein